MPKKKIHDIDNDTPLIPEVIAEGITRDEKESAYLCERARLHYSNNLQFRKGCNGSKCREYLHSFMNHWLQGQKARKMFTRHI